MKTDTSRKRGPPSKILFLIFPKFDWQAGERNVEMVDCNVPRTWVSGITREDLIRDVTRFADFFFRKRSFWLTFRPWLIAPWVESGNTKNKRILNREVSYFRDGKFLENGENPSNRDALAFDLNQLHNDFKELVGCCRTSKYIYFHLRTKTVLSIARNATL